MSYQIKSTPFFRRMLTNSKRNGELQKLKDEYERIKDINDRTIEMKMREVRLKRLFREIEEIKETSSHRKRQRMGEIGFSERPKSSEEIRLDALMKAKTLGKEYSKLNALMVERSAYKAEAAGTSSSSMQSGKVESERKARIAKRISYGNEISRTNLEKAALMPTKSKREQKSEVERQKDRLRNRLSYGNSCSSFNMAKLPKRCTKHNVSSENVDRQSSDQLVAVSYGSKSSTNNRNRLTAKEAQIFKTFNDLQNSQIHIVTPEKNEENRLSQCWRKLALTVRNQPESIRRRQQKLFSNSIANSISNNANNNNNNNNNNNMITTTIAIISGSYSRMSRSPFDAFELRSISNDTHLPLSQLDMENDRPYADCMDDPLSEEELIDVQLLNKVRHDLMLPPPPRPPALTNGDELKMPKKHFESAALERPMPEKEEPEIDVQKLRSIFEHQGQV